MLESLGLSKLEVYEFEKTKIFSMVGKGTPVELIESLFKSEYPAMQVMLRLWCNGGVEVVRRVPTFEDSDEDEMS